MAVPVPIQFAQGTTVGLIILQGANPLISESQVSGSLGPLVNMAPITTAAMINNNNNTLLNNNNIVNNNNNSYVKGAKHPKAIKPAPAKGANKKSKKSSTGTTPPLKPPKNMRDEDNEILRCKRRLDFAKLGLPFNRANPVAVARRNERERRRVKQINSTFLSLRDHLPNTYCPHKNPNKMSKVETLRGAIDYINSLQDVLGNYDTALTAGGFDDQTSNDTQQQQQSPQQQQQQQQQIVQQEHQHYSVDNSVATSGVMENVNRILSVQATDSNQNVSLTSPTGSSCSSVCSNSSTGSVYRSENATPSDYYNMSYVPLHPDEVMYHQHNLHDTHQPMDIKEEDLLEFAHSWL